MILVKGEGVIKEWNYAVSKQKSEKTTASLVVTNKRIIHDIQNKHSIERTEVPIAEVKSVHFVSSSKSNLGAIMMIVLGVILAIVGIVLMTGQNPAMSAIGFLPIFLGVVLVIVGILGLNKCAFGMEVLTRELEGTSLVAGAIGYSSKKKKRKTKIKIKVNKEVVADIIDSLGAIIIDFQSNNAV